MPEPNKDAIKEAFIKAKQDIFNLSSQIESLKREIQSLKEIVKVFNNIPADRQTDSSTHSPTENITENKEKPAQNSQNQTPQHINQAHNFSPKDIPTHNQALYDLKSLISNISIGNEGVPADRQTNQQSNRQTQNIELNEPITLHISQQINKQPPPKTLEKVLQVLESLDSIKKELRTKFKRLTQQEMVVFTAIYQLEEEGFIVDYPLISQKLQLTESSIRDYIQRILKKGIPLQKTKENNKKILVCISPELKKIATLSTINQLREL